MKVENIKIWDESEYRYKMAYGFIPSIMFYLHEDEVKRPFILVVPGGGYGIVSYTEGEIVAEEFYKRGYNVGVLIYTVNITRSEPLKKQPLEDIGRAIRYIRKNERRLNIFSDKLCLCGFSAGGHLSGLIAVHNEEIIEINEEYSSFSAKPDAIIMSYAVTTFGEYTHIGSVENVIGSDVFSSIEKYKDEIEYFSLENHVSSKMPPCFIWHTATDDMVPVENSFMFAQALQKEKVPYALHIFSYGPHMLSVVNDRWQRTEFGEAYTYDQVHHLLRAMESGELKPTRDVEEILVTRKQMFKNYNENIRGKGNQENNPEVAIWVDVVEKWLDKTLRNN